MISSPNAYFTAQEAAPASKPIFIFTLDGDYEIPQEDIIDPGQLELDKPTNFSDITTASHTLILNNKEGIYSPGKSTFIWAGDTWYRRSIKIELGYERLGWQDIIDKVIIFEGIIIDWKLAEIKDFAHDAPSQGLQVEITSNDHTLLLTDRLVGKPDIDGNTNPLVHGTIFRQAEKLDDKTLWTPDESIDYETGDMTQVDTVYTGGGTSAASATDPQEGVWCCEHHATSNVGNGTYCEQDVGGGAMNTMHISAQIKFVSYPVAPVPNNMFFLSLVNHNNSTPVACLTVTDNSKIGLYIYNNQTWETNVLLDDIQGQWHRFSIMSWLDGTNNQWIVRAFMDGDDICTQTAQVGMGLTYRYCRWGTYLVTFLEEWIIYTDNVECFIECYPNGYYLPGGAYTSINKVYVDGGFWPRQNRTTIKAYWYGGRVTGYYMGYTGRSSLPENYRTVLTYGLIDFLDFENAPSGSIIINATKDTTDHPVDHIEALLTEVNLDSYIDAVNFAAAKTATPNDSIGVYIEDSSAGDAISSICQKMAYDFVERQGQFGILPYSGTPNVSSVLTLNRTNCYSMEMNTEMGTLQTEIEVIWGWYERDKRLFYNTENVIMSAVVGIQTAKLDLSYGQDISSNNGDMAQDKADLMLKRFSGPIEAFTVAGNLSLARIELGDGVLIDNTNINEESYIYEVVSKAIDMTNKTVEIIANRYLAEFEDMMLYLGTINY